MQVGLLARKVGMTQIYQEDGTSVPVTVLECGPCTVLLVRTEDRDGYHAVQLGFDDKKAERHPGRAGPCPQGQRRTEALRPRGSAVRTDRRDRGSNLDGRAVQGDQTRRRHGHEQRTRLYRRHQAARLPRPPRHARREANASPSRLIGPQRRSVADPEGGPQTRPSRPRPVHGPQPRSGQDRRGQQPAPAQRSRPGPARRLPDRPPDEQGLVEERSTTATRAANTAVHSLMSSRSC